MTNIDLLAGALRDALQSVRSDGRVAHDIATRLRDAVAEQRRRRGETPSQDIVSALPAFETLSEAISRADAQL